MKIQLSNNQLIIRPSKGNGIDFQVFTHRDIKFGLFIGLYNTPFVELDIPLITVYLGYFNRKEYDRLDRFFSMEEFNFRLARIAIKLFDFARITSCLRLNTVWE